MNNFLICVKVIYKTHTKISEIQSTEIGFIDRDEKPETSSFQQYTSRIDKGELLDLSMDNIAAKHKNFMKAFHFLLFNGTYMRINDEKTIFARTL